MCDFQPRAESARGLPSGVRFFLAVGTRPDSPAQADVPAFDVGAGITLYAPDLERRQAARSWRTLWRRPLVLSVAEYEELYRARPPSAAWYENAERAAGALRAWARSHSRLAQRAPARGILEGMERELQRRRASPGSEGLELELSRRW